MSIKGLKEAVDKETDEYGFMAVGTEDGISVSDSFGGGTLIDLSSGDDLEYAKSKIAAYIERNAEYYAEAIIDDLGLEELEDSEEDDE